MRWALFAAAAAACSGGHASGPPQTDAPVDVHLADSPVVTPNTLDGNRDRLLATYLAWLQAEPTVTQSNGLTGQQLHSVCELWSALDPSSQDTFRTITHRLWGSVIASDGTHSLEHVVKLYRLNGGGGATSTDPGTCGGGEDNRMIMHIDTALHTAQLAANTDRGASPYDISDVVATSYWRDSHDVGGPHAPFDTSDETNSGAPRGQTQYFGDPMGTAANQPLGRQDLMTLVDPYAMEMDQDYDCVHNSNPDCTYQFYGPGCAAEASEQGVTIYTGNYGDFEPAYKPAGC